MNNIAVLGTASDVGKSIVATALCRIFANAGIHVAPFKAQNMSNNSGVTADGDEMGRAQIVQALAARVLPHADMNPVLLKPNSDTGAQVVLQGKVHGDSSARGYFRDTGYWASVAFESLDRLAAAHELLVIEGAGSCAEMNLHDRDFVNFRTARRAGASVILVADIDRGGVFAQVAGTLAIIDPEERKLVKGVVVNRFRGDRSLFDEGVRLLESLTGVPVLGVIPFFHDFVIDAEDAVPLSSQLDPKHAPAAGKIGIAVLGLPHISNFTDLSPLQQDPSVELHWLRRPKPLDGYRALILPGSKNVRGDLDWLLANGWGAHIEAFRKNGGVIFGICGGYQLLGTVIDDPHGVEGEPGKSRALGLLPVETVLACDKQLSTGRASIPGTDAVVRGYEIHMGRTVLAPGLQAFLSVSERNGVPADGVDGARSSDGKVMGTYFHGFFDEPEAKSWFLGRLDDTFRFRTAEPTGGQDVFDRLAAHVEANIDLELLFTIAGIEHRGR